MSIYVIRSSIRQVEELRKGKLNHLVTTDNVDDDHNIGRGDQPPRLI